MKTKEHPKTIATTPAPKKPCNIPVPAQETAPIQKKGVLHVAGGITKTQSPLSIGKSEFTPRKTCNKKALNFVKNDPKTSPNEQKRYSFKPV